LLKIEAHKAVSSQRDNIKLHNLLTAFDKQLVAKDTLCK